MDHVTAELLVPVTRGENVILPPLASVAVPGDRLIPTLCALGVGFEIGCSTTETDAVLDEFALLVAITEMVCCVVMLLGAVYTPFEMVPTCGESDQLTPVFVLP